MIQVTFLLIAVLCFAVAGLQVHVPNRWNQGIAFGLAAIVLGQLIVALLGVR
jgi:hypothetical protein